MDNAEVAKLIEAFKGYRELLGPVQENLSAFIAAYESVSGDISRLNEALSGDIKGNLDKIYRSLSDQAAKATDLSARIDRFASSSEKYFSSVEKLGASVEKVAAKVEAISALEERAEKDLGRLENMLEERKRAYDVKSLGESLEKYSENVKKISEFVDTSVAGAMKENNKKLSEVIAANGEIVRELSGEKKAVDALIAEYRESNKLLKSAVENNDVNMSYVYEILDKWAVDRKLKISKKSKK